MSDRPYSRLYHELADEYQDVYDGPLLADYMRLLVAADQAHPTRAKWHGHTTKRSLDRLVACGLVILDGARYSIKGMDKERAERSARAVFAANSRWSGNASSNAPGNATGNAHAEAPRMPSRDETSRDETSRVEQAGEDVCDLYYRLTIRTPNKAVMDWLDRLVEDHGKEVVEQAMAAQWSADPSVKDFLGRVEMSCAKETKRRSAEAEARRAKADAEYERQERERIANPSPEELARAEEVKAGIRSLVERF